MKPFNAQEYWEQRLKEQFDVSAVGCIGLGKQYNTWLYRVRAKVFLRQLQATKIDFPSACVLDIGSGTGFYVDQWKKLGVRDLVGVDLTQTSIARLRRLYPEYGFYQVDIGGDMAALKKRTFDVVSAFDVLFHILEERRYEAAIDNIHSLLVPGGLFVFSENFVHSKRMELAHQVCRRLDTIQTLITKVGFEVLSRSPMFYLMNTPVDTESRTLKVVWRAIRAIVSRSELAGFVVGAVLYPIEMFLVSSVAESPTTEIMLCRKLT